MFRFLIVITGMMIAFTICGMTSKRATEIDTPAHATGRGCCRNGTTGDGLPPVLPSGAQLQRHPATLGIMSLKGGNLSQTLDDLPCYQKLVAEQRFSDAAVCFLEYYGQAFKLDHPSQELSTVYVRTDNLGLTHVRLRQTYGDITVWPGEITVHFLGEGQIYWVQGNYSPTPRNTDLKAGIQEADALKAVAVVLDRHESDCPHCTSELVIYAGRPEEPVLAYRVSASVGLNKGWNFYIDAHSGAVLHKISSVNTAPIPTISK